MDDRRFYPNGDRGRNCRRDLQTDHIDLKIISGGQTGVDRAALDVALQHGVDCGGWCPRGRLDEHGIIPARYPLRELEDGGFAERTRQNVGDSDGTLIVHCGELRGGTAETVLCCVELDRPHRLVDAAKVLPAKAATLIAQFVRAERISTLNVAGPRESEWPHGYDYTRETLEAFVSELSSGSSAARGPLGRTRSVG